MNKIGYQYGSDNTRSVNAATSQRFYFNPIESDLDADSATKTGLRQSYSELTGGGIVYSRQVMPYNPTITQETSLQTVVNPVGSNYISIKTTAVQLDRNSYPESVVSPLMHRSEMIAALTTQLNRHKYITK
jgi:hypothetical protein